MKTYCKNNSINIWLMGIGLLFSGCSDFLAVEPKGKVIPKTTEEFDRALSDPNLGENINIITPFLGDEVCIAEPYDGELPVWERKAFQYVDNIYQMQEESASYTKLYYDLFTLNKVINEVVASTGGTEQSRRSVLAEALVMRAWINFTLVNHYGKPYNPNTAATDLGIVLVKQSNINATDFTRAMLQETYDWILKDLNDALPALPAINSSRYRIARSTGEALLGKVYFMMADYQQAEPLLASSLTRLSTATIPLGLYDYHKEFAEGGSFRWDDFDPLQKPSRGELRIRDEETLLLRESYYSYYYDGSSALLLAPQTLALFSQGDLRMNFISPQTDFEEPLAAGLGRPFGRQYYNTGLNVPEIYLQLAESQARNGKLAEAITTIEILRKNRMPEEEATVPSEIADNRASLVRFIIDESVRECVATGYRWYDMRRLSIDEEFKDKVNRMHIKYNKEGQVTEEYPIRQERLTLRIPLNIIKTNPHMQQNL